MRRISVGVVVAIMASLGIATIARQQDEVTFHPCAYSASCQSYEVLEAQSLAELKEQVRQGLEKAGWQPQGGIAYDAQSQHYLQVMVHARKIPSYP